MQGAVSLGELLEPDQFHEKINFLVADNRKTHITGKLKPLIWTTNVISKSFLVSPTLVKINYFKWQDYLGVEICLFCPSSCQWNLPRWRTLSKYPTTATSDALDSIMHQCFGSAAHGQCKKELREQWMSGCPKRICLTWRFEIFRDCLRLGINNQAKKGMSE